MNPDLEMGTRGVDRASIAQDAPGVNHVDGETASPRPTQLSGQQVPLSNSETGIQAPPPGSRVAGNNAERLAWDLPRALEGIKSVPAPCAFPNDPSFGSWKGLLWKMGLIGIRERKDEGAEGRLKIRILHQYNVLWARSKLLRHYEERNDLVDDEVAGRIQRDLQAYCKAEFATRSRQRHELTRTRHADALQATALRDYQFFQTAEGEAIYPISDGHMNFLTEAISRLEGMRSELKRLPLESAEAKDLIETTGKVCDAIGSILLNLITVADFNARIDQTIQVQRSRKSRLGAAFAGGGALLLPMIIMIVCPGQLPALMTTYCFVFAVAIALAILMRDSQPKDIFACVAAYAAVLVVFVGTGQSSSDGATGGGT